MHLSTICGLGVSIIQNCSQIWFLRWPVWWNLPERWIFHLPTPCSVTENFRHLLSHWKQTANFSSPPPFVIVVMCSFNPEPVEPSYLGENVMEEEKRHDNMTPSNKHWPSLLAIRLKKSPGTSKQFIEKHIPIYLGKSDSGYNSQFLVLLP